MRFTLTFLQDDFERLTGHLFRSENEEAAYLLCGMSTAPNETRLLVREVIPVPATEIDESSQLHMQIQQPSFLRPIKGAAERGLCFVFAHSHPPTVPEHSPQDDRTEESLFRTAYNRIHNENAIHGSMVFSSKEKPVGRISLPDGTRVPMERIRVVGRRFRFAMDVSRTNIRLNFFSRQILVFGDELQKLLRHLTIGIVGMGGTGSAVAEQLVRLGVGRIIAADAETLEDSNVTRVYGSHVRDVGAGKVELLRRHAEAIGLGTIVEGIAGNITDQAVARRFRECDVIFGCVDRERGRAILTQFALQYLVPVFDLGVKVESEGGDVKAVEGRITTLLPGAACLFCRGRISGDVLAAETLAEADPAEYERLRLQGYVPELQTNAPAVIPFTSSVASFAVTELLHRLSGYMGEDRTSTELFLLFDDSKIIRNSTPPLPQCRCADPKSWGQGDSEPFLGLTWPSENP
ncbi:MAG: ThiF family adenylyltransferase [Acidobacteria bacterium]|nr:MAG: ThiF family adenylyltransferase [Acidobacteriota bacterium]